MLLLRSCVACTARNHVYLGGGGLMIGAHLRHRRCTVYTGKGNPQHMRLIPACTSDDTCSAQVDAIQIAIQILLVHAGNVDIEAVGAPSSKDCLKQITIQCACRCFRQKLDAIDVPMHSTTAWLTARLLMNDAQ